MALLEEEAGVRVHNELVERFTQHVAAGQWPEVVALLGRVVPDAARHRTALLLVYREMFLERIDAGQPGQAVGLLREEIGPLCEDHQVLQTLSV